MEKRVSEMDVATRLIRIISLLAALRAQGKSSASHSGEHIEAAYDDAVEALLTMRAPQKVT